MEDQATYFKKRYPSFPQEYYPTKRRKKQSPTNELTDQVIKHIKSMGGVAYRINSTGNYNNGLGKWIMSGQKKGLPDVIGILHGRFIGIEIKIGSDRQSEDQRKRQTEIEAAGGIYFLAKSFEQLKEDIKDKELCLL